MTTFVMYAAAIISVAIVSIPTLLIMAAIHFFWQKRCDKKAGAIEAKAVESKDVEEIKG